MCSVAHWLSLHTWKCNRRLTYENSKTLQSSPTYPITTLKPASPQILYTYEKVTILLTALERSLISLFLKTHIHSISMLLKTCPESYHFSTSPKHRFGTSCCFPHLRLLTSLLTGHPAFSTLCHLIVYSQQSSQCELLELSKMRLLLGSKPSNDFPSYSEPKPNSSHLPRRGSI